MGHDDDDALDDRRWGSRVEDASRSVRLVIESIRESRKSIKALRQEARRSIIEVRKIRYGMMQELLFVVVFDNNSSRCSLSEHDSSFGSEIVSDEEESL